MRDKDDLDALLDAALSTYSDAAAPPDLDTRVLASIGATAPKTTRRSLGRWMPWAIAVPAAAMLLLTVVIFGRHRPAKEETAHVTSAGAPAPAADTNHGNVLPDLASPETAHHAGSGRAVLSHSGSHRSRAVSHEPPLPRQEIFPAPQPLSPEERALIAVTNKSSSSVNRSVAGGEEHASDPLVIAAIQIPPIKPPDKGGN
jgi:hypothetical protein